MAFIFRKLTPGALDKAGATASLLCAIHCALMPLLLVISPLMALSILATANFEWILFGVSAILGTTSICWGYRTHRSRKALAVLACGLALLGTGNLLHQHHDAHAPAVAYSHDHSHESGPDWYTIMLVAGGLAVMASHAINNKLCKSCSKCSDSHCTS